MLILAHSDGFRVDLHQLRSGSCRRRAIETAPRRETSRSGTPGLPARTRNRRMPRLADDHFLCRHFRECFCTSRLETLGFRARPYRCRWQQLHVVFSQSAATTTAAFAACRCADKWYRSPPACRCRQPQRPSRRCADPDRDPWSHAGRQGRPSAGRAGYGEDVNRFVFGALATRCPSARFSRCISTLMRQVQLTTPLRQLSAGACSGAGRDGRYDLLAVALFRRLVKLRVGVQGELEHAFVAAAELASARCEGAVEIGSW